VKISLVLTAFFLTVMLPVLAACRTSNDLASGSDVQISAEVTPDPPVVGEGYVIITVEDAAGQPVEGATVQVRGDMDHAGMEPVEATAEPGEGSGEYIAVIDWNMGGDWSLSIGVALPDGGYVDESFDFSVDSD